MNLERDPNEMPTNPLETNDRPEPGFELLLDRLASGEGSEEDWESFRAIAGSRIEPWQRLAEEQRMTILLNDAVNEAIEPAAAVELTVRSTSHDGLFRRGHSMVQQMGGWAAAAAVAALWITTALWQSPVIPTGPGNTPMNTNDVARGMPVIDQTNPDDLLTGYLESPHVVRELEPRLVGTGTTEDGSYEVTYVRQILERVPISSFYEVAYDESANPVFRPNREASAQKASFH